MSKLTREQLEQTMEWMTSSFGYVMTTQTILAHDAAQRETIAGLENKIEETETEYAKYRLDDLMRQADFTVTITRQAFEIERLKSLTKEAL